MLAHVPGNILEGNWTAAVYLDDEASAAQEKALLDVYTGQKGGPVADLAKLVGTVVSVQKVPITFTVQGGYGTIKVGDAGSAELEPYKSASGATTTLTDTVFSTVPGAPVFVGKATSYRSKNHVGLGLGVLMAAEKNVPGDARLRLPIGLGLVGAAVLVVVANA